MIEVSDLAVEVARDVARRNARHPDVAKLMLMAALPHIIPVTLIRNLLIRSLDRLNQELGCPDLKKDLREGIDMLEYPQ